MSRKYFLLFIIIFSFKVMALPPDLIKGDQLYDGREKIENAYQALSLYEKYLDVHPNDPEALWRASMANYYIGHLLDNQEKRKEYHKRGIVQGENCVTESKQKVVQCYFWLATNTALYKQDNGVFSMAFGIGSIIKIFEKALKLDPLYAGAGSYRMLSLLHYKAPGFLGGDTKKAYTYINKAIELSPNEPLNYYFLIKFLKEDGETEKALSYAKAFSQKADPKKFSFFESRSAYKNILYFLEHKVLPKEN